MYSAVRNESWRNWMKRYVLKIIFLLFSHSLVVFSLWDVYRYQPIPHSVVLHDCIHVVYMLYSKWMLLTERLRFTTFYGRLYTTLRRLKHKLDCFWSQKLCFKSDPRYGECRNWFYIVFNHFRVCWIQCRAVPSSTIYAKARILRLKVGLENRSKISQKQRCQQVMSQYKTHTCCFICDPPYKASKNNFTMFLTIFEYAESDIGRC